MRVRLHRIASVLLAAVLVSSCRLTDDPRPGEERPAPIPPSIAEPSAAPVEDDRARPAPLNVDSLLVPLDSRIEVTPALRRGLEEAGTWFSDVDRVSGVRRVLNGDGRPEVAVVTGCGSSGACVAVILTGESADRFRLLLVAGTLEPGLALAPTATNGWPDLISGAPPHEIENPGPPPYRFVYDGARYVLAR